MTPTAPRRAATVMLLRPSPPAQPAQPALQILLVRRARTMAFMADAYVFPGGRVDEADRALGEDLATRVCAARELREEVGVVLPSPELLAGFARWITPSAEPRRFDTDFFLAPMPPGQEPLADGTEVVDLLWLTPAEALLRAGDLKLPPPTLANLEDLQAEIARLARPARPDRIERGLPGDPIDHLLEIARRRTLVPVLPKLVPDPEGLAVVLPWHPDFAALPGEGTALPPPEDDPGEAPGAPAAQAAQRKMTGTKKRTSRLVLTAAGSWVAS